ncbi:MAG TPA: alanine racemase [Chloroflexota bacterium]|jgi:alanine racemase|nr:alanine racemase [Chloroflexota bacterium]
MSALDYAPPMTASRRVTRADIYLDRIAANVQAIRGLIGPGVALLAVIKADGYGHGAIPVAHAALAAGAQSLGVACVDEGVALRQAGVTAPILVMGHAAPEELRAAVRHDLTLTLGTATQSAAVLAAARHTGGPVRVHLKIDTGMGRFGILPHQLDEVARTLRAAPEILVDGCCTHLARGEEDPSLATDAQLEQFEAALGVLRRHGIVPRLLHAANSGATLMAPRARFDMVRAGLLVYGYRPDAALEPRLRLRPALELRSCLVRVETLPAGSRVGYGHTYQLERPTRIGLVPIGYADGLQRALSGVGYLVAAGRRVPIVGRISMDQCTVDLAEAPEAREGDPVTVIGQQGEAQVWADDLATWAGTISYEILCGISPRVPRYYLASVTPSAD